MSKKYAIGDRVWVQSQQIYLITMAVAAFRINTGDVLKTGEPLQPGLVMYKRLTDKMGRPHQGGRFIDRQLSIIANYCRDNGLPALNAIVVYKDGGHPGNGVILSQTNDSEEEWQRVWDFNWFGIRPPTTRVLRDTYENHKTLKQEGDW